VHPHLAPQAAAAIAMKPTTAASRADGARCVGLPHATRRPRVAGARHLPAAEHWRKGEPSREYGVAWQSRTNFSCRPRHELCCPAERRPRSKQRTVSIEYPRSGRIGGCPLAGRNRGDRVGASRNWTPEARLPRSPPLDSRCWRSLAGLQDRKSLDFGKWWRLRQARHVVLPGVEIRLVA
jgi:hypothetical protein